jgi:hypothetical protein
VEFALAISVIKALIPNLIRWRSGIDAPAKLAKPLRQKSNFVNAIKAESTVQCSAQKYSARLVGQIISISSPRPVPDQEGRFAVVTSVGRGMRWTPQCRKTDDIAADGEVVWS